MQLPRCSVVSTLLRRELAAYFYSPIAYVFLSIFVLAIASTTIFLGRLFDSNSASMNIMFTFLPWIFIFLVPAVGMRLWSEERSTGSIEFLLTLPISVLEAVLAKFLAGWIFLGFALVLTFCYPATIFILGSPDVGAMLVGYLGAFLIAGSFLSVSCFTSAITRNQVISFVFSFMICFVLTIIGWGVFSDLLDKFLPSMAVDFISSFGVVVHFENFAKGVLNLQNFSYYILLIVGSLALNIKILEEQKKN